LDGTAIVRDAEGKLLGKTNHRFSVGAVRQSNVEGVAGIRLFRLGP
jgi:hypothetical protein